MSRTYFDNNQNLQVNGDINFISMGGPSQNDPSFFHVSQHVQTTTDRSRAIEQGFKILCENTAPSALYGYGHSFKGPQCYPGTRIAVQDYIFKWFDEPNGQIAMWMNGPVGIGKSAIAHTIAQTAAQQKRLSSAFFFFRSDDKRNSTKHLVPTLAYSMVLQMPRTRDFVCEAIAADPLLFSCPLDHQIHSGILQPLYRSKKATSESPRLIIIDGLDECLDTSAQQGIIRSFISSFLSTPTQMIPHKLLIVSRPESDISAVFSGSDIHAHVKHLSLGSWETEDDLGVFLRDKLRAIKDAHPMRRHLPSIWPDENSFRKLRRRAVGSFAYASAVIRFLASHKHDPALALRDILSLQPRRSATAFADLDTLYRHILSSLDPDIRFTVQKVLCLHLYSGSDDLAFLAEGLSEEQSVLEIALVHVSSLVYFDGFLIKLHHSSFGEFLGDKERSGNHHIFANTIASTVATALSKFWLNPDIASSRFNWLHAMSNRVLHTENDLNNHILRALVATKIPASSLPVRDENITELIWFFRAIQQKCVWCPDPLRTEALNVVCSWLRSQLNDHFQGLATLSDILGIILKYTPPYWEIPKEGLGIYIFCRLAKKDSMPFDFLCRLFPEMDLVEVCSRIVEKYLALSTPFRSMGQSSDGPITLSDLYVIALGHPGTVAPQLCRRLEQLVLDGRRVLSFKPDVNKTSKDCISHILYGEAYYIDTEGQWDTQYIDEWGFTRGHPTKDPMSQKIVEETDRYIRRAHEKLDFPYISEDVEALYRAGSQES